MPDLTAALIVEYCLTQYRMEFADECRSIYIGRRHPELDHRLMAVGVETWAIVTASNPRSKLLSPADNEERHRQLTSMLHAAGYPRWSAWGVGRDPAWPAERSLLIGRIDPQAAADVARSFDQHAIVIGTVGQPAALRLLGGTEVLPALHNAWQSDLPVVRTTAAQEWARLQQPSLPSE